MRLSLLAGLMGTMVSCAGTPSEPPAHEPFRLHPANPHYFLFRGQPTVLVTATEHYGAVLNLDFDYVPYLDALSRDGMNLVRVFTGSLVENEGDIPWWPDNSLAPRSGRLLVPWARSAVPGYKNGGTKFDLSRWDDTYFVRLRDFVHQAGRRGIVVEVTLFGNPYRETTWSASPLHWKNNINGLSPVTWSKFLGFADVNLLRFQEALLRKIAQGLNSFDNVYYEICNEPYNDHLPQDSPLNSEDVRKEVDDWHRRMICVMAEADFPRRHLIATDDAVIDHPGVSIANFHYVSNPSRMETRYELNKAIAFDETAVSPKNGSTLVSWAEARAEAWEHMIGGGAVYDHLSSFYRSSDPAGTAATELRRQLRVLRDFMEGLDFIRMRPAKDVLQGDHPVGAKVRVLREPGKTYIVYIHHGQNRSGKYKVESKPRRARFTLALPKGTYLAHWIDPAGGALRNSRDIRHAGGTVTLESPVYVEDIVLRIHSQVPSSHQRDQ